jgi:hypothetical protein
MDGFHSTNGNSKKAGRILTIGGAAPHAWELTLEHGSVDQASCSRRKRPVLCWPFICRSRCGQAKMIV